MFLSSRLSTPETKYAMIPKNRIHLSRSLHAQTTPYPEARAWIKRGALLLLLTLGAGIYLLSAPRPKNQEAGPDKQILGGQEQTRKDMEYQIYRVKKGDTLFNLSQKYEVSWQTLAEINNLEEPYLLKIGQELKVPVDNGL